MPHKEDGGPAFPLGQAQYQKDGSVANLWQPGMSLRDYLAAQAMVALIRVGYPHDEAVADRAYWMADTMLAKRGK